MRCEGTESPSQTPRIVVAGYGNPLRRDDGAGWRVAIEVEHRWSGRATVLVGQQPLPEWAEAFGVADVVYMVDASVGHGPRLEVRRLRARCDSGAVAPHTFSPEHLMSMTAKLYGRAPAAYMLVLPAQDVGFGEDLSPLTARAVAAAVRYLGRRLTGSVLRRRAAPCSRASR
jgi:hydrogenase maturation protease